MMGYEEVQIGSSKEDLLRQFGPPRNIIQHKDGAVVYEYVERLRDGRANRYLLQVRRYYFIIKDDKVIAKTLRFIDAPGYYPYGELLN